MNGKATACPFVIRVIKKKYCRNVQTRKRKISHKTMDFMTKVENCLTVLDKEFQVLTNIVEHLSVDTLNELKTLETEKNKLMLELGSRKNAITNKE